MCEDLEGVNVNERYCNVDVGSQNGAGNGFNKICQSIDIGFYGWCNSVGVTLRNIVKASTSALRATASAVISAVRPIGDTKLLLRAESS